MNGRLLTIAAVVAMIAAGCDDPSPAPRPPATGNGSPGTPVADGTPRAHAIVAREGDRLVVVIDVPRDAGDGRRVATARIEVDGAAADTRPVDAARVPAAAGDVLTVAASLPRDVREVRLVGTFEDGGTWTRAISTVLDAR
jgi:hypothetical protein